MMKRWMAAGAMLLISASAWAISPYIEGDPVPGGSAQAAASAVEARLKNAGFKVIGKYFPQGLEGYGVVIATDPEILDAVGSVGGPAILGAAIRVGVKANGNIAYTNPDYWYRAYFRKSFEKKEAAVKALQGRLQLALGAGKGIGGDESAANLANYRYMVGMERLDSSKNKLAEYENFADAVRRVREHLAKGAGKTSKVYEVVMPDRKLAVFGVAMNGAVVDGEWIKKIDMQEHVAALPYEIYVVDNQVGAPHARFRVALAFPDVGMGQFMRISSLPNAVIETMSAVAGVEKTSTAESWK